jgi:chemotaxis protein CheC
MCPTLDDQSQEILLEYCSAGASHAAAALSRMTGRTITVRVPTVAMAGVGQIPAMVDDATGDPHAGVFLRIHGDAGGSIGLILSRESAFGMLRLMGVPVAEPLPASLEREEAADPLGEMGNILTSSYLTAISRLANKTLVPSVPEMVVDIPERIIRRAMAAEDGALADGALVVKTLFEVPQERIWGTVFLIPDETFLAAILEAVA